MRANHADPIPAYESLLRLWKISVRSPILGQKHTPSIANFAKTDAASCPPE